MNVFIRSVLVKIIAAVAILGLTAGPSLSQIKWDLHKATETGALSAMQERIDKGDDVNGRDKDGFTPLMLAAMEGKAEAINLLLRNGADINAKINVGDLSGFSALIGAVGSRQAEASKALIANGANIHGKLRGRYSPLVIASAAGLTEVVGLLLQKGADRTNLERDIAEWKKIEWAKKHNFQAERAELEVALRNAYTAAQAYLMEKPKSTITTAAQLAEYGWRYNSESIIFVRADLSETAGSIVLKNRYLDESNSTAVSKLQVGEGLIDFKGDSKLLLPK